MDTEPPDKSEISQQLREFQKSLNQIEERVRRLEQNSGSVRIEQEEISRREKDDEVKLPFPQINLEQRIGAYWFAQLGIVILLIGLIFLISYAFKQFQPLWQAVVGYGITLTLYALYRVFKNRLKFIASVLFPGSLLLLYFVTLRLHFFHSSPIIVNKNLALILLLIILGFQVWVAWKRDSQWLAFMPLVLGFLTALLSNTHHFALSLIVLTALMAALMLSIKHWQLLGLSGIVLGYGSFLLYLLNDPLLGKQVQILPEHDWMIVYLLVTLVVYAVVSFRPNVNDYLTRATRIGLTTLNSSGFYLVAFLITFQFFKAHLAFWNFIYAGVLFTIAVAHWTIRKSKYSTSFYASFSYIALTMGILAATKIPNLFLWLVWQSALVIGTAIWFQSNIIIMANMGIFLIVLFAYLFVNGPTGFVNFNFTLVAILSERLLIFAKQRIKKLPVIFQQIYVVSGYAMLIYGLALVLPKPYISVAWFIVSAVYLVSGYLMHHSYYRWVGFVSFIIPVGRIFVIDLASLEPIYRVLSFVLVGIGLLVVAIFYANRTSGD